MNDQLNRSISMEINTGARLHFGPLSYLPECGRHFGGIGLMVNQPGVALTASLKTEGTSQVVGSVRAGRFLKKILATNPDLNAPLFINVQQEVPSHQGLGSGTQLGLAVSEAVFKLNDSPIKDTRQLALQVGRGLRSAVGVYGYEQGGFLVEAGQLQPEEIGALATRLHFPEAWTIELISLRNKHGMHGAEEVQVFRQLDSMPESFSQQLCKIVLTEMLPAIQQQQLEHWCAALDEYGQRIGEFFAEAQGGVYASPVIRDLVQHLRNNGITGIAQSSWGPTIAIFASASKREQLHHLLQQHSAWDALSIQTAVPMNTGRRISITESQ